MYCLVDFRNRPQFNYTFHSAGSARVYLRKIKNNPLGATVVYSDGRREYFERGLPREFLSAGKKIAAIKKGCHIKYAVKALHTIDSLRRSAAPKTGGLKNKWRLFESWPIFMLGNRKFYACLFILAAIMLSSAVVFEKKFGSFSPSGPNQNGGIVLGMTDDRMTAELPDNNSALKLADEDIIFNLLGKIKDEKQGQFETELLAYIKGKPMADMAPYIAKQPRTVAAFIIGIAMKESKFGVYAPHDASGNDCHNYWGYRGPEDTTASGYSCFSSPEEAIKVVGGRIARLVDSGRSNPSEMVVWKCGATCSWDNPENVRKWIADVGIYFSKINT